MLIIDDLQHKIRCYYGEYSSRYYFRILRTDGTSAMFLYRLSRFFLRYHLGIISSIFRSLNRILNSCWIGRNADFGQGFVIMHPYAIVINSGVKGGKNIVVQSGVVIGVRNDGKSDAVPLLGDNIFIGSGAKLLGGIRIGDNVTIGANAVILSDIPDNATAVGVPGKVIKIKNRV
jgi:serine O-acetyltransferase